MRAKKCNLGAGRLGGAGVAGTVHVRNGHDCGVTNNKGLSGVKLAFRVNLL